jgi:hypothetical protein
MSAPAAHAAKQALIVIGMHRSGTSATTGALRCLGVQLGRKLYSGHQNINAKGYFEHSDIADTNEEALLAMGSAWDDIFIKPEAWWKLPLLDVYASRIRGFIRRDFSTSPLWAVKDPRVCRMLPWWLDILSAEGVSPKFLFVVRSPEAVFRSLERRDGFSRDKAYLLWSLHYLEAERCSRGYPRAFMDFDSFLDSPRAQFERVSQHLELTFPTPPQQAAECLNQFVSKDLRHHNTNLTVPDEASLVTLGVDLHDLLLHAARSDDARGYLPGVDALWQRMVQIQKSFPPLLVEQLTAIGSKRGQLQITIEKLVRSWSWYTGKPVRYLERLLGRDV